MAPAAAADDQRDDLATGLLVRVGRGDRAAFDALYDAIAPLVFGVVLRVVRDRAQTEEVTQEVFVELWRLAPRFDPARGSAATWASTIAHRRAVDRVRSEEAVRRRQERQLADPPTHEASAEQVVQRSLQAVRVRRALDSLTAAQREAVELAYFGGHTYREVAVLLGIAEGTAKSRIRDAMIRLRDELGAEP